MHYAAFVSMFPHLIAGPIVRYADIEEQLRAARSRGSRRAWPRSGLFFFACRAREEAARSPTRSRRTSTGCSRAHDSLGLVSGWAAALGYALQLYFDFSGYSDMAVGLAFLLGFRFPQNFDSPYKARQHLGVLAALAHVAVVLAPRLPLHPARRLARGSRAQRCATWSS